MLFRIVVCSRKFNLYTLSYIIVRTSLFSDIYEDFPTVSQSLDNLLGWKMKTGTQMSYLKNLISSIQYEDIMEKIHIFASGDKENIMKFEPVHVCQLDIAFRKGKHIVIEKVR